LFKCDCFKLDGRTELKDDGFFKSINFGSLWYKNDSYILATQARKVFYLADTKLGKNWHVVQTFDHRHLYNVSESDVAQHNAPAYQENKCCEENASRQTVSDNIYEKPLSRDDEQGLIFEAAEIAQLVQEKAKKCMGVIVKKKKMMTIQFWSIATKPKKVLQMMLTVMTNS
jgi:hypothetical protein